jgi:hypothetical protein
MQIITEKKVVVTLRLDEQEAFWLKGYVQNRLSDEESDRDAELREKLFTALKDAGVA